MPALLLLLEGWARQAARHRPYIFNDNDSQYLDLGNLTVRSGADYAAAYISTQGADQTLDVGAITLGTTGRHKHPGTSYATIEHLARGRRPSMPTDLPQQPARHRYGGDHVKRRPVHNLQRGGLGADRAAGDARYTANGAQGITVTGALSVASSSGATALVKATGVQTIGTSGSGDRDGKRIGHGCHRCRCRYAG